MCTCDVVGKLLVIPNDNRPLILVAIFDVRRKLPLSHPTNCLPNVGGRNLGSLTIITCQSLQSFPTAYPQIIRNRIKCIEGPLRDRRSNESLDHIPQICKNCTDVKAYANSRLICWKNALHIAEISPKWKQLSQLVAILAVEHRAVTMGATESAMSILACLKRLLTLGAYLASIVIVSSSTWRRRNRRRRRRHSCGVPLPSTCDRLRILRSLGILAACSATRESVRRQDSRVCRCMLQPPQT